MDLLFQIQVITVLLVLVFLYHLWLAKTHNSSSKSKAEEAPEPTGAWPVIGHLLQLTGPEPLFRTLGAMADRYGPTFNIRFGMERTLVVSSWESAKECFTINDKKLANRPRSEVGEFLGYNYTVMGFSPYGPYWRVIRKIVILKLLSNHRLESYSHVRNTEIKRCINRLFGLWVKNHQNPVKVEMNQLFGNLTTDVIVRTVAGKRCFNSDKRGDDNRESSQLRKTIIKSAELAGVSVASDAIPFLSWMNLGKNQKDMKRTADEMDMIAQRWLEEHLNRRESSEEATGEEDFVDVLLSILKDDDSLIPGFYRDKVVKATCLAIILAAIDTTSITLTWALSLILNNGHVLEKAQKELDIHVGKNRHVEEIDMKNLVYLQAIVKETLRLYPPVPLSLPHEAIEDCYVSGFRVPAGTRVLTNIWKLQRDPILWSDPLEFLPERFLTTHRIVDVRGQHFELIPFGTGRRSCPGISFALQTIHMTLARLLHGFELRTPSNEQVDMTEGPGLTLPKVTPLEVFVTPRLSSALYE